jgi:hypothetical protein
MQHFEYQLFHLIRTNLPYARRAPGRGAVDQFEIGQDALENGSKGGAV